MNLAEEMELADYQKMEQVRSRADEVVEDKDTAEALKPYYRQFCKRPCFHDEYLPTFNRPNVTLIHTDGKGVDQITSEGIIFDGEEYKVDCIIFATGFEVGTDYSRRAGLPDKRNRRAVDITKMVRGSIHIPRHAREWLSKCFFLRTGSIWFHRDLHLFSG